MYSVWTNGLQQTHKLLVIAWISLLSDGFNFILGT